MKTIRTRLLAGLIGGMAVCVLAAIALLYSRAVHEVDEDSDQRLRQLAWWLPVQAPGKWRMPLEDKEDDRLEVHVWNAAHELVFRTEAGPMLPLPRATGYATIEHRGGRWRVYADLIAGYSVQVAQPAAMRQRAAFYMALRTAPPLLLLFPAMALLIWIVVGRAMRPLENLTMAVRGRTPLDLQPLNADDLSPELLPIVSALNGLLDKIDGAIAAQRNFVSDAAHELRSPLTALKLQLRLAEVADGEQERRQAFRKLHERLDRATHLVQQLMTLARQEQGTRPPHGRCDLLRIAQQTVADHAIYADSKRIDLGISADAAEVYVHAHGEGLAVMLSNLVDNALRYTHSGGQVDVMVGMAGDVPFLQVADNGPGVPEQNRERLFDRFYRPDGNEVWGCGLGLSIVKSVADAHQVKLMLGTNGIRGLAVTAIFPAELLRPVG
ncbi:ATP-binding protein [Rugamonas apoptosis]|uniref:histidine kinase n=1 Tax=Rugamonas apoptosis TaxID=2758570 RepID=A0A7W2INN3_9BURK|nr:ATP-binding protein [Rugamonas apoptosis]MBA5690707.1 two-component sensor histidine kinase [Rugamonas apoptosis]